MPTQKPNDEHLMATDQKELKYAAQESRIKLKDGLLYRQYYSVTETVKYLQVLSPEHPIH